MLSLFDERDKMDVPIHLNHKDALARVLCRVGMPKDIQQASRLDRHNDGLKRQPPLCPQRLVLA